MGWAAATSFVAAIVGYLPSAFAKDRTQARLQAAMLGVGARLLVTLVAVLVLLAGGVVAEQLTFVVWIGIDYALLLFLETLVVLRGARTVGSASA
jgi:hypothetical protein